MDGHGGVSKMTVSPTAISSPVMFATTAAAAAGSMPPKAGWLATHSCSCRARFAGGGGFLPELNWTGVCCGSDVDCSHVDSCGSGWLAEVAMGLAAIDATNQRHCKHAISTVEMQRKAEKETLVLHTHRLGGEQVRTGARSSTALSSSSRSTAARPIEGSRVFHRPDWHTVRCC